MKVSPFEIGLEGVRSGPGCLLHGLGILDSLGENGGRACVSQEPMHPQLLV